MILFYVSMKNCRTELWSFLFVAKYGNVHFFCCWPKRRTIKKKTTINISQIFWLLFNDFLFVFFFFFIFFVRFFFILIKKQFSLSIFRLHFIVFVSTLSFLFLVLSSLLFVFDYLLNDIMTSNLVINQILIVLFVAVNINTDRYVFLDLEQTQEKREVNASTALKTTNKVILSITKKKRCA